MTKVIAFYLPQYHCIPENDEWWGESFTDWVNVKNAKSLFWRHNQPRVPYKNNYYDLSDADVMTWQMKLAEMYNIYGFCFYHYWFNGKLLLEKPAELLLKNMSAKLPFCFCWANEPWTRTWDGLTSSKETLMPQVYGGEIEWRKHYEYLLDFFNDDRYIKIKNRLVFLIYRETEITNCYKMQERWDTWAKEDGFAGVYFIKMRTAFQDKKVFSNCSATVDFEPMRTMKGKPYENYQTVYYKLRNSLFKNRKLNIINYRKVCKDMLTDERKFKQKHYLGAFVGWDNTPRKGRNGLIMKGSTPEYFKQVFTEQYARSQNLENEFLFINAWNEWAEGTYLEPDNKFGYQYLEIIKDVIAEGGKVE